MDRNQFEALCAPTQTERRSIRLDASAYSSDVQGSPRTLLYGFTCDRATHHVFQDEFGHVHLYVYRNNYQAPETPLRQVDVSGEGVGSLEEIVPDKRLYPQHCDYDFCRYLKKQGIHLSFTTWEEQRTDPERQGDTFHGRVPRPAA